MDSVLAPLVVAVVSTGSSELVAVTTILAYDVYRWYFNRNASPK